MSATHRPPLPDTSVRDRFLELAIDIAGTVRFDGTVVSADPAFSRALGASPGESALPGARDLLEAADLRLLGERWRSLVAGESEIAALTVSAGAPRRRRWYVVSLIADRAESVVHVVARDLHAYGGALERFADAETRFQSAFETAAIGMTITSLDARFMRVNAAFAQLVGRPVGELVGSAVRDVSDPAEWQADRRLVEELVADPGRIVQREKRYVRPDGTVRVALLSVSAVAGEDGATQYLIAQMVDITRQREAERALAASERRFRTLAMASPAGIFSAGLDGRVVYANDRLAEIFGIDAREADARRWLERIAPAGRERLHAAATAVVRGGEPEAIDVELERDAGTRWVRISLAALPEGGGDDVVVVGTVHDVTAEVQARADLAAREAEYRVLAEHSGDVLSRHDLDGRFLYASSACETLFGLRAEQLIGRTPAQAGHIHPEDVAVVSDLLRGAHRTTNAATGAWRVVRPDGRNRWLETALRAVRDAHGRPRELVAVTRDVSERKDAELRLAHQAMHDALTGLPNRALFLDRLEQALRRARRGERTVAVLFVDLDRFKLINDSFGHAAGDRLVRDVAARLRAALRPGDTLARFGGDELTVLCEDLEGEEAARAVAGRIAALFDEPFLIDDGEAFVQSSIGVALAGDGATADDLIRDADAAMYRAKDRGGGRVELFDEALRRDARERVAIESALRRAIERDELCAHVQPVVGIRHERIVGFEALVRWQHPERGLVPPGDFIPLAEETGLIVPIGNWMVREACRTLRRWERELGADAVQCSVNLSVRHLQQPDLVATVRAALEEHGVRADRLVLEITESAVMENGPGTVETLEALRAMGVRLALDDFGTGYSSLAHLHRFPLDVLKIDRSFTAALGADHQGASIAGAIVSLAQALGLRTVAEGIETPAQRRELERLGCAFGQGFLFARPQPPEAFDDVLRRTAGA